MSKKPVLTDEQTGEVIGGGLAKANPNATVNPTVTDDASAGYAVGSTWLNATSGVSFNCTDATIGAAVWIAIGGGTADMEKAVYDPTAIEADAFARANHTGTQAAATISDFDTEVDNNTTVQANATHAAIVTGNPHAVSGDELNSDAQPAGKIIETDGAGGFVYLDTPSGGGSAAGSDRSLQVNDGGAFGAVDFCQLTAAAGFQVMEDETGGAPNLTLNPGLGSLVVGNRVSAGGYGSSSFRFGTPNANTMKGCVVFGATNNAGNYSVTDIFAGGGVGNQVAEGAIVGGATRGTGSGADGSRIRGYGFGIAALGCADGTGGVGDIQVGGSYYPHEGSFAFGSAENGSISCDTGVSRKGAIAFGRAYGGGSIQANADGAIAFGTSGNGNNVIASAAGAVQINAGTNNVANSLRIGGGGGSYPKFHFLGNDYGGDPYAPVNGQFWQTYNFYYGTHAIKCRNNGVTKDFTNIP